MESISSGYICSILINIVLCILLGYYQYRINKYRDDEFGILMDAEDYKIIIKRLKYTNEELKNEINKHRKMYDDLKREIIEEKFTEMDKKLMKIIDDIERR